MMKGNRLLMKIPAVGGSGGDPWDDSSRSRRRDMNRIFIFHGDSINSIRMKYGDTLGDGHGSESGNKFDIVNLTTGIPDRFSVPDDLTWISGHFGHHMGDPSEPVVIRSIKFGTAGATYGPFGTEEGTPFSFQFTRSFRGFHGRSDSDFLHAIGAYVDTEATDQSD